jgi:hypothetical protein
MANFTYQCSENKFHKRDLSTAPLAVPMCCGKPMSQVQNPTSQPAPSQPAPSQPVAGAAKPATSPAPTVAQAQKPVTSGPSAQPAQKK